MKRTHLILLLLVFLPLATGCDPDPVPEEAVKACIENGGTPDYYSNGSFTRFKCIPKDGAPGVIGIDD